MDYQQSAILAQEIRTAIENGFQNTIDSMRHDQRVALLADIATRLQVPYMTTNPTEAIEQARMVLACAEASQTAFENQHIWAVGVNPGGFKGVCYCGWSAWQPTKAGLDKLRESHLKGVFLPLPVKQVEPEPDKPTTKPHS